MKKILSLYFLLSALVFSGVLMANDKSRGDYFGDNTQIDLPKKSNSTNYLPLAVISAGALIQVKRYSKSLKQKPKLSGGEFLIEKEDKTLAIGFPQTDGTVVERLIAFLDQIDSINLKAPVKAATTANIVLSGLPVLDGIQIADKDAVLVWNQTNPVENGIWIANAGNWSRRTDSKGNFESAETAVVYVKEGATWGDMEFNQINDSVNVGTSALVWTPRSSSNVDGGDVDLLP